MKRFSKSMLGVTLLEIMLVLAIAAMIIVMSVRYYQSASSSQQANAVLQQLQGITAAADGLAQATGSYSGVVTGSNLAPLLPGGAANAFTTPWGTQITVSAAKSSTYKVSVAAVPTGVCPLLVSKLATNNHYTSLNPASGSACKAGNAVSYTYTANP